MPLYEYECDACGSVFEVMQKFADEPLTVHANCGGHVHRLLCAPALQFKGSGWYITDYGKGGRSSPSNGSKSDSHSESKSESKPAAKSDSGSTSSSSSSDKKS